MIHKIIYYFYYIIISILLINPIFTIYPVINLDNRFLDLENKPINTEFKNSNTTENETSKDFMKKAH